MSVATRPLEGSGPPTQRASREPLPARILSVVLAAAAAAILAANWDGLLEGLRFRWAELLFWAVVVLVVNLLPLYLGELVLTLDMAILLAIAFLYTPPVAMFLSGVAALDVRELDGRVTILHAVYNRAQIGISVYAASVVFHEVAGPEETTGEAALGTVAAIAVFHIANIALVVGHAWLRNHKWSRLSVGGPVSFLVTYLGYGALALVFYRLYLDVGAWSIITLLIPIVVAREALRRGQRLQLLTDQLRDKEYQLERNLDQIVDERRDERVRIGAELHDDVLQSLIRISQLGHFLKNEVSPSSAARLDADEVVSVAGQAIAELRQVVADLQTSPLGRSGLVPTLRSLGRDLQLEWRVPIKVKAPASLNLADEEQLVLYQVAKEAITNALRHASANSISVRLEERGSEVFLEVRDDGQGFEVDGVDPSRHFGLALVKERVRRRGGQLTLESEQRSGTSLSVLLPREAKPDSPRSNDAQADA